MEMGVAVGGSGGGGAEMGDRYIEIGYRETLMQ